MQGLDKVNHSSSFTKSAVNKGHHAPCLKCGVLCYHKTGKCKSCRELEKAKAKKK